MSKRAINSSDNNEDFAETEFGTGSQSRSGSLFEFNVQDLTNRVGYLEAGEIISDFDCSIEYLLSHSSGEADIYLASKNHQAFVIKLYRDGIWIKSELSKRLLSLIHPSLVRTFYTGIHKRRQYEVLEYLQGGALTRKKEDGHYEYLPLKPQIFDSVLRNIIMGLKFLHDNSIIHRDIKPANILVRNIETGDVVLSDFGISTVLEEAVSERMTSANRTEGYAAPEIYSGIARRESDFYALGITAFVMLTGADPFHRMNPRHIMSKTVQGRMCDELLKIEKASQLEDRHKQLLKGLLTARNDIRWSSDEVLRWLEGISVPLSEEATYEMPAILIDGKEISDIVEFSHLCFENSEDPSWQTLLYSGKISAWLKHFDSSLAAETDAIAFRYLDPSGRNLSLKVIAYALNPLKGIVSPKDEEILEIDDLINSILSDKYSWESALGNGRSLVYLWLESKPKGHLIVPWCRAWIDKCKGVGDEFFHGVVQIVGGQDKFYLAPHISFREFSEILSYPIDVQKKVKEALTPLITQQQSRLYDWCELGSPPPRDKELLFFWRKFYKNQDVKRFLLLVEKFWVGRQNSFNYAGEVIEKVNPIPHGFGVCHFDEGGKYVGSWKEGKKHGNGILEFDKVKTYVGNFENDEIHGEGKLSLNKLGSYYEGSFSHGAFAGHGSLFINGLGLFQGSFKNGLKHGPGCFSKINKHIQEGSWVNDVLQGFVKEKLPTGELFEGFFEGGLRHGKGRTWQSSEKVLFEGNWMFGLKEGPGFWRKEKTHWIKGTWKKGEIFDGIESKIVLIPKKSKSNKIENNQSLIKSTWKNGKIVEQSCVSEINKLGTGLKQLVKGVLCFGVTTLVVYIGIQLFPKINLVADILFVSVLGGFFWFFGMFYVVKAIQVILGLTYDENDNKIVISSRASFQNLFQKAG